MQDHSNRWDPRMRWIERRSCVPMAVKPCVRAQEVLDDDARVDGAAVPKEHHRSTQMPEKVDLRPAHHRTD